MGGTIPSIAAMDETRISRDDRGNDLVGGEEDGLEVVKPARGEKNLVCVRLFHDLAADLAHLVEAFADSMNVGDIEKSEFAKGIVLRDLKSSTCDNIGNGIGTRTGIKDKKTDGKRMMRLRGQTTGEISF